MHALASRVPPASRAGQSPANRTGTVAAVWVVLAASAGLGSSPAAAQTTVVVGDFDGRGSSQVRTMVVRALSADDGVELIPSRRMEDAARRLQVSMRTDRDYAQVASAIEAAAIVEGTVGKRGAWGAEITVRSGATGEKVAEATFRAPTLGRLRGEVRLDVMGQIGDALRSAPAPGAPAGRGPEEPSAAEPGSTTSDGVRRLVILGFDGPGGSRVGDAVAGALTEHGEVALVPAEDARATADRIGADLGSAAGRTQVARELQVAGWVEGAVERAGRGWRTQVQLFDGADGAQHAEASFVGRNPNVLLRKVRSGLWGRFEQAVADSMAPIPEPSPEPAPVASQGPDEAPGEATAPDDRERGSTPLDLWAGFHVYSRDLSYNDDVFGELRGYRLDFAPEVALGATWYPAAHFTDGFASHLGVEAGWAHSVGISSSDATGDRTYPTRMRHWDVGLRGRVPIGPHQVGVLAGYGRHHFHISPAGPAGPGERSENQPGVPDVNYRFVRMAADGRVELGGGFAVGARVGYLHMLGVGEIGTEMWFPRGSAGGLEADATLSYALVEGLEMRLGFRMRRFFFDFDPEPGDPRIAGGAVDQYLGGSLDLAYRMQ